jgi:hypothetical protein
MTHGALAGLVPANPRNDRYRWRVYRGGRAGYGLRATLTSKRSHPRRHRRILDDTASTAVRAAVRLASRSNACGCEPLLTSVEESVPRSERAYSVARCPVSIFA